MLMKELVIPFATGLAIFLFGMQIMRIGFENIFLEKMKSFMSTMTGNPLTALLCGTVATAILQSSSAVTLIIIGLTHAKFLNVKQAIGLILGVNIGTVVTVEILALEVSQWSPFIFVLGVLLFIIPHHMIRCSGLIVGGVGLLFIGMNTVQTITPIIKTLGWIDSLFIISSDGILGGVMAGTILTGFIQSSSAVTMMTMNLFQENLIPLNTAIAITLGSNIGTCLTAIIGAIGASLAARQVAIAHILLNTLGVLVFIPFVPLLGSIVEALTSSPAQEIAHAQLIFNVVCSLLVLAFVSHFERLVQRLTPQKG